MVPNDAAPGGHNEATQERPIPVTSMVESIIGCKWSVRLLQLCDEGPRRPSALLRACPGLSAKVMNERLRKMIRFGMLQRTVFGEKPPVEVEYQLTAFGRRFMRIIEEVRRLQAAVDRGAIAEGGETEQKVPRGGWLSSPKKALRSTKARAPRRRRRARG